MVPLTYSTSPPPSDADLRRLSAQTAGELQSVCRDHGWALHITAGEPANGSAYVQFPPLRVDVAQEIVAGLRRLLNNRCAECAAIKRRRAQAIRDKDMTTAAAAATAMGRHQRAVH
ncbi:hypothetical protein [Streptomyces abikoensis]|uniref:Uncharacterized protein n=1 Tax=Streptomyces abikoensis TaxID=97398 RepID=A0ABW7T098_9ACTN|nr:hypothetical protein [Streptomyces abikoensis]GGP54846.1 hypothetical protein GCM10010214_29940 [Streptomyces abikoensis]